MEFKRSLTLTTDTVNRKNERQRGMNSINLKIGPRFVKQDKDGFRLYKMEAVCFQR